MKLNIENLLSEVPITKLNYIKKNEVYCVLEKFNMCGSIKVKPVYFILKNAINSGKLNSSQTILEASSGNTAISLAYLGNLFNLKIKLVIPENTASCKKKLIKSYGAELIEVPGVTDDAIEYRDKIFAKNPQKYFLTDQFNNIDNFNSHYYLTGPNIDKKIGKVDFFVAGYGTTGTLLGTAKYLKEKNPNIKIIAINPVNKIEGLKNYETVRNLGQFYLDYKYLIDEKINVDFENDAISGINDYLQEGYFNGISSGAILSGTKKYLKGKKRLKGVIIAPDGGDYYFSELFKYIDKSKVKLCK